MNDTSPVLGFRREPGPLTVTALDLLCINADERISLFDWLDAEWSGWWRDLIWSMTLGEGVVDMERYSRPVFFLRDEPLVFTETRRISCLPPIWPAGRAADRFESTDDVPILAMGHRTEADE